MKKNIKILYFDKKKYTYNKIIHSDSIEYLSRFSTLITVGNNISGDISYPFACNNDLLYAINKENPDVIITYNAASNNRHVFKDHENILASINIPKIHISTDYCRHANIARIKDQSSWFKELGYSAALFRHRAGYMHQCSVDKYDFPFSIDEDLWKNNKKNNKIDKVGFFGTSDHSQACRKLYVKRNNAIKFFEKNNVMFNANKVKVKRIIGSRYPESISTYAFGLTCGGTCNFLVAKHFEIPASGGILVCDGEAVGLSKFPKNSYLTYSEGNMEDCLDKILYFNKNIEKRKVYAKTLENYVYNNHTHNKRCQYLIEIIKQYI